MREEWRPVVIKTAEILFQHWTELIDKVNSLKAIKIFLISRKGQPWKRNKDFEDPRLKK